MGKPRIRPSTFLVISISIVLISSALILVPNASTEASSYQVSCYGFRYNASPSGWVYDTEHHRPDPGADGIDGVAPNGDGMESWSWLHNQQINFSGIETIFESGWPSHPSAHKALCLRGWPSHYHYAWPGTTERRGSHVGHAWNSLDEDTIFVCMGHGDADPGHGMAFFRQYQSGGTWHDQHTYLYDFPRDGDPGGGLCRYISEKTGMDDMLFAYLRGCNTANGACGGQSLTWWFRTQRGVDHVIGWTAATNWWVFHDGHYSNPSFCFNECFWIYSMNIYGNGNMPIWQAAANAAGMTLNHCGTYGNLNLYEIWSKNSGNETIISPHAGINEGRP